MTILISTGERHALTVDASSRVSSSSSCHRSVSRHRLLAPLVCGLLAGMSMVYPAAVADESTQTPNVHPLLVSSCLDCHSGEDAESGIRLERLTGAFEPNTLRLWSGIRRQIVDRKMPPEDAAQPSDAEREELIRWIDAGLQMARSRPDKRNGLVRRLTAAQYRNMLRDLLGLQEEIADSLPPDGVSRDGFTNNVQTLLLSPLQVEAYLNIARRAVDLCLVDESTPPTIQCFQMDLGKGINRSPVADELILGALSELLDNSDFVVTQPIPDKPFDFDPIRMRTSWRFIEGYQGNSTVRGWREYNSIYHSVFACVRGAPGYPKGLAWETVPDGLLLRPSVASTEVFQVDSTYGPQANFKVALRQLPHGGRFRVTVQAARYDDGLLLDPDTPVAAAEQSIAVDLNAEAKPQVIRPEDAGIWQIDLDPGREWPEKPVRLQLTLGDRSFSAQVSHSAFLVVRLPAGPLDVSVEAEGFTAERLVLTRLKDTDTLAQRFRTFEQRSPLLGVHVGLRRDCGSTLAPVGRPRPVASTELQEFVFEGAILNYPTPNVEKDNVNYLAGVREIGVRSEYTDGRDRPRLLLKSVRFEGPYYDAWPPESHRRIMIDADLPRDSPEYARVVIRNFASRAFRRPVTADEEAALFDVWQDMRDSGDSFQDAIRSTLQVILTSPQFLFVTENSESPLPELLDEYELASKLSCFLWNTVPDDQLLQLAADNSLHAQRRQQVERMIADPRFDQGMQSFVAEWLDLRRLDVVEVDRERFPELTEAARSQLRQEPVRFMEYLIRQNLPLQHLVQSDTLVANEVVAAYYGLGDRVESGFEFVPVLHRTSGLGGILTQAGLLSGLSDGRESNPVKRGAWLARRVIAEPPADPPPNVPELPEDNSHLSLRERLQQHRDQEGCAACHRKIDPWGLPLEQYDAGGRLREETVDCRSELPDGTVVDDAGGLREYLVRDRSGQLAFSFLKHVATYANGRSLTWNEIEFLREHALELNPEEMRLRDLIQFVVGSDLFLMK